MKEKNVNSIIIALFLSANPIAWIIPNSDTPLLMVIITCWLLVVLNRQLINLVKSNALVHFSTVLILLLFLISFIFHDSEALHQYFVSFIGFGISGIYFSQLKFDINKVFRNIAIISLPVALFVFRMDMGVGIDGRIDYGKWMGVSYGVVRFVIVLLIMIIYYKNNVAKKVLYGLALLLYIWFFAEYGSRGAVLAIMFFVFSYPLTSNVEKRKKVITISILGVFMLVMFFNFIVILKSLNNLLNNNDIQVFALEKVIRLADSGNIDNGRAVLFENGIKGFIDKPLFGNGIGAFEEDNFGYVHNFIIQIIYEGGIVFFIPILYVLYQSLKIVFGAKYNRETKLFVLFLISSGLIELLFSSTYWRSVFFWFYIFYTLNLTVNNQIIKGNYEK